LLLSCIKLHFHQVKLFTVGMLDDSPVFMMDLDLESSGLMDSNLKDKDDVKSDMEIQGQVGIEDQMAQPQQLEYSLLAPNINWLDTTASGVENHAAATWNNIGAGTGANKTDAWILGRFSYNFENMPGGDGFSDLQSFEAFDKIQ
jgi:hypothetical protein